MSAPFRDLVQIEPAGESALPAIARLAGSIWRACYPGIISSQQIDYMLDRMYSLEALRREIISGGICYQRLFVAGEFAGFASYGPAGPDAFKLHKLYLHPEHHGRGLGGSLLQHCEREVRKLGAQRLTLNVNKQNAGAIAFYRRNGFVIVEPVIIDIGEGFVMDDYIMAKQLAS
jgi:ribosomal protein S18 acetylase RimI-like enzyme